MCGLVLVLGWMQGPPNALLFCHKHFGRVGFSNNEADHANYDILEDFMFWSSLVLWKLASKHFWKWIFEESLSKSDRGWNSSTYHVNSMWCLCPRQNNKFWANLSQWEFNTISMNKCFFSVNHTWIINMWNNSFQTSQIINVSKHTS